jgi:hypothetical protein
MCTLCILGEDDDDNDDEEEEEDEDDEEEVETKTSKEVGEVDQDEVQQEETVLEDKLESKGGDYKVAFKKHWTKAMFKKGDDLDE